MTTINIADFKDHLSEVLERVEAGEEITVCRRQQPVAVLRPVPKAEAPRTWADVRGWMDDREADQLQKDVSKLRRARPRNPFAA